MTIVDLDKKYMSVFLGGPKLFSSVKVGAFCMSVYALWKYSLKN